MTELWQIFVPRAWNNGNEVPLYYHREWDEKVRKITRGLTILKSAKGIWESPKGEIFEEGMIPVLIACSEAQIEAIVGLTMEHYDDQMAVMAYRVSDRVIIRHRT